MARKRDDPFDFWYQFLFSTDLARSLQKFSVDLEINNKMIELPSRSIGAALYAFRRLHTFELIVTKNWRSKGFTMAGAPAAVYRETEFLS